MRMMEAIESEVLALPLDERKRLTLQLLESIEFRLICVAEIFTSALAEESSNLRVLFVGNSLTYYNDVPGLVRQMSRSADQSVDIDVEMLAAGGASIAQHIQAGHLQRYLRDGDFDFVVFQDIGGWPICPPEFPGCADQLHQLIKSQR